MTSFNIIMNIIWRVLRGIAIVLYAFFYLTVKIFVGCWLRGLTRCE